MLTPTKIFFPSAKLCLAKPNAFSIKIQCANLILLRAVIHTAIKVRQNSNYQYNYGYNVKHHKH